MSRLLSQTKLREATRHWLSEGKHVAGPRRVRPELVQYAWLSSSEDLVTTGFVRPANSIKGMFFPQHERLFTYQGQGRQMTLVPVELPCAEQIVLAARPCDAAALPVLDQVFNWDYQDCFFRQRRENTTVVTIACREHDCHCFCTSLGLAPDATRGSDVLLVNVEDELFEARFVTERGRQLLEEWTVESDRVGQVSPGPEIQFHPTQLHALLQNGWDELPWQSMTLSCLGCGACAHNCPVCHCFDIVDEATRQAGCRVRNWDSCQEVRYSLHASGHNPRSNQSARQQNRIRHKFSTYPEKFGEVLCTGCGACARNCPAGLGVRRVVQQIIDRAGDSASSTGGPEVST
ncbi:MAG: 4Fe-4S dicluster domain-containing protein [Pirellulaceae bacterium]